MEPYGIYWTHSELPGILTGAGQSDETILDILGMDLSWHRLWVQGYRPTMVRVWKEEEGNVGLLERPMPLSWSERPMPRTISSGPYSHTIQDRIIRRTEKILQSDEYPDMTIDQWRYIRNGMETIRARLILRDGERILQICWE